MKHKGIAVAGNLVVDQGFVIDKYPKQGNLTWISKPTIHTGGANNILIDLAKMDNELSIKVSGLIGTDEKGEFILEQLGRYSNISTENIKRFGRTATTYVMTEKTSKQRTFFFDPGESQSYSEHHLDLDKMEANIFHLEYLLLLGTLDEKEETYGTRAAKVLAEAKRRGMETSIDMVSEEGERYKEIIRPSLKYTDYFIANEVEGSGVTDIILYDFDGIIEKNIWLALERLKEFGVAKWAIIHSPACGYGLNCQTGERAKVSSYKLPEGFIKGTTGAGDAFCAGILLAAYKELGLKEALKIAAMSAACSLTEEDSNSGVQSLCKMKNMVQFME